MKTRVKKEFRVFAAGETPDLFNLRNYTLISRAGESYEVRRSDGKWNKPWAKGQDISVDVEIEDSIQRVLWGYVNVDQDAVKRLPDLERHVLEEAFSP